ncbi:hypothetical protein CVT26_015960 [Gymnopilus dilepis]|uniref:G protein-coupled receptor n=1 Tax=Gymnopilus dilepis TaxID=231916 RepID=A0A409WAD3_9AGAR|nr:hypothetical protein CVT26_015960 [Gymnopilus dilepis]
MDPEDYSKSSQQAFISSALNTSLLSNILFGIYTVIFFYTLYISLKQKSSQHGFVLPTISLLYLLYVAELSITWYQTQQAFVDNGDTRETVFTAAFFSTNWVTFVDDVIFFLMAGLADGLMIWRCFVVWNGSLRVVLLPLFFMFCEIAINLSITIIFSASHLNPDIRAGQVMGILLGVSLFMTLATTVTATLLIAYRIRSLSSKDFPHRSSTRFGHVLEILLQSAAIYSVAALPIAIASVIPYPEDITVLFILQNYLWSFYVFAAGIGPTVMVARIVSASQRDDVWTVTHLSGLQFGDQSSSLHATESSKEGHLTGPGIHK